MQFFLQIFFTPLRIGRGTFQESGMTKLHSCQSLYLVWVRPRFQIPWGTIGKNLCFISLPQLFHPSTDRVAFSLLLCPTRSAQCTTLILFPFQLPPNNVCLFGVLLSNLYLAAKSALWAVDSIAAAVFGILPPALKQAYGLHSQLVNSGLLGQLWVIPHLVFPLCLFLNWSSVLGTSMWQLLIIHFLVFPHPEQCSL